MLISWLCHQHKMNANKKKPSLLKSNCPIKALSALVLLVSFGLGPNRKIVCTSRRRPCALRMSVYLPVQTFHIRKDSRSFFLTEIQNSYVPHRIKMETALSHETSVSTPRKTQPSLAYILPWGYEIWRSVSIIKTNRLMLFRDMS
jgi:hypothetical protein